MSLDRDRQIRLALTPEAPVTAPADLFEQISRVVRQTPQRRPLIPTLVLRPTDVAPALRLVLIGLLLLALLAVSFVALSRLRQPAALMYHGGPERTGVLPGPGPAGAPFIVWEAQLGGPVSFSIMPLVADGRVVIIDEGGTVYALDEATGTELWRKAHGSRIRASPLLSGERLIFASDSGDLVAMRSSDATPLWSFSAVAPVSAALVEVNNVVYVPVEDGVVHAVDVSTGRARWSYDAGELVNRGAAVSKGVLFVGSYGGRFSAIDVATADSMWSIELGPGEVSTPIASDGRVYVGRRLDQGSHERSLVALDVVDGEQQWEFRAATGFQVRPGALGDTYLYVVAEDGNVYALDRLTGALAWSHDSGNRIGSLASLAGSTLYVSSTDGSVRALDAHNGSLLWKIDVEGEPTIPVVINGRVIVATTAGKVVAIAGRADAEHE